MSMQSEQAYLYNKQALKNDALQFSLAFHRGKDRNEYP